MCLCLCVCDQTTLSIKVMEALPNSCSKAIVERLGSYSPRGAAYVSDRLQFCFYKNENKGCNFGFLKLVQNKGIYPIHAVPSQIQVGLETVEQLELQAQQTSELKIIRVKFQLQKKCLFGEQFLVVGDNPIMGSWNPSSALPMTWSDGHIWTAELNMPAGKAIQFKFLLKGKKGDITWQPGSDRIIHAWQAMNRITVCEDWENAGAQRITREDYQLAHSNEEPNINSKMLTFAVNSGHSKEMLIPNVAKVSGNEDSQTHTMEKPLTDQDLQQVKADLISYSKKKPMDIVSENIGSSEEFMKNTSQRKTKKKMIHQNEESANIHGNDAKIHYLRHNGNAAPIKNQEMTFAKGNNFIDFKGGPIIVPGMKTSVLPTEETGAGEVEESP